MTLPLFYPHEKKTATKGKTTKVNSLSDLIRKHGEDKGDMIFFVVQEA